MFFELAHDHNHDFPTNIDLPNGLVFNCDSGWRKFESQGRTLVYKGYHTEGCPDEELFARILQDHTPRYRGNFCLVIGDAQHVTITHSHPRSFPLVHQGDTVSNLRPDLASIGSNEYLTITGGFEVTRRFCEPFTVEHREYTLEQGLDAVHELLSESFERFLSRNSRPLKVFLSGGMDTTTVYTYLKHFTTDYELVDYEYQKHTHFYRMNYHSKVKRFWSYTHFHTWGDSPAALVTGAHGDEIFLRSQDFVNLLLMHHGEDIHHLLDKNPDCYHYKYLQRHTEHINKQRESKLIQSVINSLPHLKKYMINRATNDHQHWHMDETLFFTPLFDIRVLQVMMGLPKEVLVQQALHGEFNRMLIERIDPDNLKLISREKNYINLERL